MPLLRYPGNLVPGSSRDAPRIQAALAATLRTPGKATELDRLSNVRLFELDITRVDQARSAAAAAIEAFGKIDVVVNNAGAGSYGPLEFAAEETIDWQFQLNVRGAINVIRAFLPHFRANRAGMFINISSFMGVLGQQLHGQHCLQQESGHSRLR